MRHYENKASERLETESLYNVVVFGDRIHVDKKKQ